MGPAWQTAQTLCHCAQGKRRTDRRAPGDILRCWYTCLKGLVQFR